MNTICSCIASSADGGKLVATVKGGGIYTANVMPPLATSFSSNTVTISWQTVGNWTLQQNDDLGNTNNWVSCTGITTVNGTNQLQIVAPQGQRFFRLH